jgi:hypothetical protein
LCKRGSRRRRRRRRRSEEEAEEEEEHINTINKENRQKLKGKKMYLPDLVAICQVRGFSFFSKR